MNLKKISFIILLLTSTFSFGQGAGSNSFTLSDDWQLLQKKEGLNFSVKRETCEVFAGAKPLVYTFMKIENNTSQKKQVVFNFGLEFKEGCSGCELGREFTVSMEIPANTTLEGDCSFVRAELTRLIYNPNLAGGWEFIAPTIKNLSID